MWAHGMFVHRFLPSYILMFSSDLEKRQHYVAAQRRTSVVGRSETVQTY